MKLFRAKNLSLILLLSFGSPLAWSQQAAENNVKISWKEPKKVFNILGKEIDVLNFEEAIYSPEKQYLPAYILKISGEVSDFKITNTTSEALTANEQKIIPSLVNNIAPEVQVKYANGKAVSFIYIVPLNISAAGVNGKITSFEYSYQLSTSVSSASPVRSFSTARTAAGATTSVLSSGNWYKISIPQSGIYKIDYALLNSMGINPSSIDPREIKIYGNGGGMLPQPNSAFRHDDLVENAIYVQGESDGIFDNTDYILFYGSGPDTWTYSASQGIFVHEKNIYSDVAYYFITVSSGNGQRVQDQASAGGALQTITTFDEHYFHEKDNSNLLHSGREWYGEAFDLSTQQDFNFNVPGITPNTSLKVTSFVLGRSGLFNSFTVALNNQNLGTQPIDPLNPDPYAIKGDTSRNIFSINTNMIGSSNLDVKLTYNKGASASAIGNLNYLELNLKRDLKLYNSQTSFRSVESTTQSISEFIVESAVAGMKIWDLTDPLHPKNQLYNLAGSQASFIIDTDTLREFVAFSGNTFSAPTYVGTVANQDLHAIDAPNLPDLVIVAPSAFLSAANRLAQFRSTNDNLESIVVTPEQIYNEFSSGSQDITAIRDFMKMLYDRKSGTDSIRYLLLFGDASYDYKDRTPGNTNLVPIYESKQSLHPIDTYSSDDYYGFLDNAEGVWLEIFSGNHLLDIGIGRLPVKNTFEAEAAVDKIINYNSNKDGLGKWKNKISFVADDGDNNLHLIDANKLANIVNANNKVYNVNKIFLDAYPQVSSPGGESCPDVNEAITQAVEKGTFVLNYTGHGGETVLAQERILDVEQINSWDNYNKLPLFITATCEFGRYDDPFLISGSEHCFLNTKGGAIAVITSTRPVYSNSNFDLNKAIYGCLFQPIAGQMPRMGDVMRLTKNTSLAGIYNRNYALLGDPSMMLEYPEENIVVTKINGANVSLTDTIRALSTVSIEGEVRDELGAKIDDFKGSLYVTVFDKESVIQTLGTQSSLPTTFNLMNNFIYEGIASVDSGKFSISFVVPKDISYLFDNGKISLYAKKDGYTLDAHGYNSDIIIGGTDTNFVADNIPPQIKLYINDESFVFGGLANSNSLFLAKLSDENGINIAGQGIGHEITAILDNGMEVIVLNEYYTAKKDNYKQGTVEFPLKGLSPGNHSIRFKCWDTYNNSSEAYLEFVVANDANLALDHILNYPNPFSTHTTFHFDHNRAGDDLDILVQVYTISGKLIKTLDSRALGSSAHISDIVWDGRDDFGDKIGKGVYIYKVNVRSLRDGSHGFKYQKLVILN